MAVQGRSTTDVLRFPAVVSLNVGGRIFATKLENLRKYPGSKLADMFSGNHNMDIDKDGNYFIDRNGKHFDYILDFLRDDRYIPPKDIILDVLNEAMYYGLSEYAEKMKNAPPLWPVINRIEDGRRNIQQYDDLKRDIISTAKRRLSNTYGIECDIGVCLVKYTTKAYNEVSDAGRIISCLSFNQVKAVWTEDRSQGHNYCIAVESNRINWFKYGIRSLLYDMRQEGYDVSITRFTEGPDGYSCQANGEIHIDENKAVFTFHWNSTWPYTNTGLPNDFN